MHWAEVRVREASINARAVLVGHNLSSAHRDKRTSQGDLKLTLALARVARGLRLSVSNAWSGFPGEAIDRVRIRQLAGKGKDGYFALLTLRSGLSGHAITTH